MALNAHPAVRRSLLRFKITALKKSTHAHPCTLAPVY
jgi:hypothetical protein